MVTPGKDRERRRGVAAGREGMESRRGGAEAVWGKCVVGVMVVQQEGGGVSAEENK